ncbi:uncharacterized protein LOC111831472 isoform X2 [Capsella rubella]|uniref:uncharacterized protein LOC111831472 isoform X2 n=1 Tax=Capsella rubella TaxID=81985 RepID=UPI000CD57D78|nr:uncharacterized protein LOC111831472 isoform X2 [Capsella rubella]
MSPLFVSLIKSWDSFFFVEPPNLSVFGMVAFPASRSGGFGGVSSTTSVFYRSSSLLKPLSLVRDVVSCSSAGQFSSFALVRCLTAKCSWWVLVCFGVSVDESLTFLFSVSSRPIWSSKVIVPTTNLSYVSLGSLTVVICRLALTLNSIGWLGLVQPFMSSSDMYVAFMRASPAVCSLWSGFFMDSSCTRYKTGVLILWQHRLSQSPLSHDMTLEARLWQKVKQLQPSKKAKLPKPEILDIHLEACISFSDDAWKATFKHCGWAGF